MRRIINQILRSDSALPRINWLSGRLRPHQSFCSFAATFCALNKLKPEAFREYWRRLFYKPHSEAISMIATLLNEPIAVVETVFSGGSEGSTRWVYGQEFGVSRGVLSFCPTCIASGFHGYCHEDYRLHRCPIHKTILHRKPFSKISNHIERYIEELMALLEQSNCDWPA